MEAQEQDNAQCKQRASVKWLLSKAFNNKVLENLREPFYRDHEQQEHLKPQIVGNLANAELYCLALGHIYSDPNYHNLNHWTILQTLTRKGVFDQDKLETEITETILIQTNPLRIHAHMAVMEAIMLLYAKEVVSADQIATSLQRIGERNLPSQLSDPQKGLLLWISATCNALRMRVEQELSAQNSGCAVPNIPMTISSLKQLSDGVALAALVSYYCPDELPWQDIIVSYIPTVSESLQNLMLVFHFCQKNMPCSIFHMLPEDITYMRSSLKQNLIAFLADLFNVLEIHPLKCVRGMDRPSSAASGRNSHGVAHKRILPSAVVTPIPDLRSGIDSPPPGANFTVPIKSSTSLLKKSHQSINSMSDFSEDSLYPRRESDSDFVVHHNRNVTTLGMNPAHIDDVAAGKPSHWNDAKRTYAGRRSRRNSFSDDSQLTIENFGGSQDHLNFLGRNPDKDCAVVNTPVSKQIVAEPNVPVRSSLQDARGSIQLSYDDGTEDVIEEKTRRKSQKFNANNDVADGEVLSDLRKSSSASTVPPSHPNKFYPQNVEHPTMPKSNLMRSSSQSAANGGEDLKQKQTSFATLPNTTTWQQQQQKMQQQHFLSQQQNNTTINQSFNSPNSYSSSNSGSGSDTKTMIDDGVGSNGNSNMSSQLNNIRMKLEEKRRHIENEKKRMELIMSKQRQKMGKAAFLQAVTKFSDLNKNVQKLTNTESGDGEHLGDGYCTKNDEKSPQRPFSLKDLNDDVQQVEKKWLESDGMFVETRKTPDIENMDLEQYQQSLTIMNNSLVEIQTDIQRLANQQNHIQQQQQQQNMQQMHYASQTNIAQQQHHLQQMHNIFSSASHIPSQVTQSPNQSQNFPQNFVHNQLIHPQHLNQFEPQKFYLHDPQTQQNTPQQQQSPSQMQRRLWSNQPNQDSPNQPIITTWGANKSLTYSQQHLQQNGNQSENHATFSIYSPPVASPRRHNLQLSRQHSDLIPDHAGPVNLKQIEHQDRNNLMRSSSLIQQHSQQSSMQHHLQQQQQRQDHQPFTLHHAPVPVPDDMEPQNISFIANTSSSSSSPTTYKLKRNTSGTTTLSENLSRLHITSGSKTYRIPSPTRPHLTRSSFQSPDDHGTHMSQQSSEGVTVRTLSSSVSSSPAKQSSEKGFYISFDDNENDAGDKPRRPKPPLRLKRGSPRKERASVNGGSTNTSGIITPASSVGGSSTDGDNTPASATQKLVNDVNERLSACDEHVPTRTTKQMLDRKKTQTISATMLRDKSSPPPAAIIIETTPDPNSIDEMEKKKERILMMSLQRRQQQEEAKARKEAEVAARREREKAKEEERARKKEEQAQRRQAILEQYKFKKAVEEAEREGKVLDRSELLSHIKPMAKLRGKTTGRPRPKTIHVDNSSVELANNSVLAAAKGKKGSTSNLTSTFNSHNTASMRRDYYRGSHDSLTETHNNMYRASPDDGRGASPSVHSTLGRRSSYKSSRENDNSRGRSKYSTYQTLKSNGNRKSNSMMNLCGSSSDQDSMMYRYGDTDSGLGRATPPRRAPSPGMGPMRHLPSPSGPGSLPGFMTKRRVFDDGSSDISSNASSMMDYSGPRLYKQPLTKSNRGIMLNAVEYCVFPGVVNREAKRRVLEEIARSESKHFLILFRDAGCQFRALYSYCPEREDIIKLYGTGPKQVNDRMFDRFFKYNSGGKCFSQVHTKHLTVTIDAFTIHNSLWQGKKVNLPNKKDMALVI